MDDIYRADDEDAETKLRILHFDSWREWEIAPGYEFSVRTVKTGIAVLYRPKQELTKGRNIN